MEQKSQKSYGDFCTFFFPARSRHTRYWRDWSSDVCSSDLSRTHPRAAAFGILRVQGAEELGHLKGDLVRLRPGSVERGHVPHEVDMQVDFRSLRDALEPVGLQAHVESLAVVQAAERDDVERLALHAIAEDQGGGLDCVEGHPPREGRLHRSSLQLPYETFADTSE